MKQNLELLILKVELSDDCEHLFLHTRNANDCGYLWSQLAGQALHRAEGHQPIRYNMPEDPPESPVLNIEADTDQIVLLLKYLEHDLKHLAFLPEGTTSRIEEQIASSEKSSIESGHSTKTTPYK
jgi:hypothetical protein